MPDASITYTGVCICEAGVYVSRHLYVSVAWHTAGSAKIPVGRPWPDQAKPSTTALHRGQSDTAEQHTATKDAPTKDATSTSILPKESRQQSIKLQKAEQPDAASAQQAASPHLQPTADTREPVLDFASHPTAVETVRHFVKSQVRWLLNSVRDSFRSSSKYGSSASQPEQQTQQKESK